MTFVAATLRVSGPLWVWAAHFAFSYVTVAVGCDAGWDRRPWAGWSALHWTLAGGGAAALAAATALLPAACRHAREAAPAALAPRVGVLVALLSLLGIAWTSAPVLLLPACRIA